MADGNGGAGIGLLGVLIGAAIVAGLGYFFFAHGGVSSTKSIKVEIQPPAVSAPAAK